MVWRGSEPPACLPASQEDRELSRLVDGLVGRVNGRFGSCDYCPVNYVKGALMVGRGRDEGSREGREGDQARGAGPDDDDDVMVLVVV